MEFLKDFIGKLGVDSDTLSKLEKQEISLDDAVSGYVSKIEKTVEERLAKQIEETKSSELFASAYAKTEKQIADAFGLDLKKYETVDKKERFKTIVTDLKTLQTESIEKLKNEYSTADAQKLQQLTQQLELANAKLTEKEREMLEKIEQERSFHKNFVKTQQIEKVRTGLIESVKNARLQPKEMRAVLDAEIRERGFDFEIDADGNIWVNKENQRVKNPSKPTENLKYETLFEMIAAEYSFEKQSNATERKVFELDEKVKDGMHPARLKYLQEKGMV